MKNSLIMASKLYNSASKKGFLLLSVILATFCLTPAVLASINGSPHDQSTEQCFLCHGSRIEAGQIPLWNDTQEPKNYLHYASQTHDMNDNKEMQPPSLLCLGCHNGIFGKYVENQGSSATSDMNSDEPYNNSSNGGISPPNSHPVCFTYDPKKDADGNKFPAAVPMPGNSGARAIRGGKTGTLYPLYGLHNDQFECTTCHIAHYNNDNSDNKYQAYLLRTDNTRSTMCGDCHQNKY